MCNCACKLAATTNGYDFATSIVVAVCVLAACSVMGYFVYRIESAKPGPSPRKDA